MLPRMRWALVLWIVAAAVLGACGGAPVPTDGPTQAPTSGVRKATAVDDCSEQPGKKAPEPLRKRYEGVAAKARCQREVFTIMGGLPRGQVCPLPRRARLREDDSQQTRRELDGMGADPQSREKERWGGSLVQRLPRRGW